MKQQAGDQSACHEKVSYGPDLSAGAALSCQGSPQRRGCLRRALHRLDTELKNVGCSVNTMHN
jgi:hypothetical protein